MKKRILAVLFVITIALLLTSCGLNNPRLTGSYEYNGWGENIIIQFDKGGTFCIGENDGDEDNVVAYCYGTYTFGDDHRTLYLQSDESCDVQIESIFGSFVYDKSADVVNADLSGYLLTLNKSEIVVKLPTQSVDESEENLGTGDETVSSALQQEDQENTNASGSVSKSPDKYIAAVDEYFDCPIEQGWALDYSYIQKIAEDEDYYWYYVNYGGAEGSVTQSKSDPQQIGWDDGFSIIYAISQKEGFFTFDSIQQANKTYRVNDIEFGIVDAAKFTVVKDGKSTDYLLTSVCVDSMEMIKIYVVDGNTAVDYYML